MKRFLFLFIFMSMLLTGNSYAQTVTDESPWELPPLQMLIDSALVHSTLMKSADATIQISEIQLTDVRRNWMNRFNFGLDSRLGSVIDYRKLAELDAGGIIPPSANIYMLNYGIGFTAYVPVTEIFDRKRKIQKAQLEMEITKNRKTEAEKQVKSSVVDAYYDVQSALKTLDTRTQITLSAGMLFDQSKIDYETGSMTLDAHMRANDTYLNALNDLELQKFAVLKAVYKLELIVGIQLIK